MEKLKISDEMLFMPEDEVLKIIVKRDSDVQLHLDKEKETLGFLFDQVANVSGKVDITLQQHIMSLRTGVLKKMLALEKKMVRAEKKKFEAQQRQLHKLKSTLFPHENLQERVENLMYFYARWGEGFIQNIYDHSLTLEQRFVVLSE
jgi:uncharacterized protein YllA (UPF0747 family)